jgi:hypothetical protein
MTAEVPYAWAGSSSGLEHDRSFASRGVGQCAQMAHNCESCPVLMDIGGDQFSGSGRHLFFAACQEIRLPPIKMGCG